MSRRWLPIAQTVALLLLLAGAVVLVVVAVRHVDRRPAASTGLAPAAGAAPPAAGPGASPSPAAAGTGAAAARPAAAATPVSSPAPAPAGGLLLELSAVSASDALRSLSADSCPSAAAASVQLTTDGGAHWSAVPAPARLVLRLRLTTASSGWALGLGAGCAAGYYATSTAGASWSGPQSSAGVWFAVPGSGVLHLPSAATSSPCAAGHPIAALAALSQTDAYVACGGTGPPSVLASVDGGASWNAQPAPPVTRVLSLAWSGTDGLLVGQGAAGCPATSVWRESAAGAPWALSGCLPAARAAAVSFGGAQDALLVLAGSAGETTYASGDGGATFTPAAA